MKYFDVAVPIDKFSNFTYLAEEEMGVKSGSVVKVPFRRKVLTGVVIREGKPYKGAKKIQEKILDLPEDLFKLAIWVSSYYLCPQGLVFSFCFPPFMKRINKVQEYPKKKSSIKLNASQGKAYKQIIEAAKEERFKTFFLFGVTGSGKTEVYLRVMENILKKGRSVLYLTPEVSMIPQVLERVRDRFGSGEAYHYKLSKGMKYSYWINALNGDLKIGVGSRMSVFSPFRDLGLIIVDEEHSESYRQEEPKPRFSAREVAIMRGLIGKFPVILGSATPSVESFYNAKSGKYKLLELPERVKGWKLPEVEVINPEGKLFSKEMDLAIGETLKSKKMSRVILFLNRRGYAPYCKCYNCGWTAKCPNCDISLTLHKATDSLICHHCGYTKERLVNCPECGKKIVYLGWGTERIEEEIETKYKDYNIQRMDTDAISRRHDHEKIYNGLKKGRIQILLGTQMVTKGLDLPDIGLVGVLSADTALNLPDFRATERTFHLLSQVAGRAGRGGKGKVIIQSASPNHYAIRNAAEHNYRGFYNDEINFRKSAGYPPFLKLARILIKSRKKKKAERVGELLKEKLERFRNREKFIILGPVSCPIGKIEKRYRYHILLKAKSGYALQRILKKLYNIRVLEVEISFEINPVNML